MKPLMENVKEANALLGGLEKQNFSSITEINLHNQVTKPLPQHIYDYIIYIT